MSSERDPDRIASLAMYLDPAVITEATRTLWAALGERLRAAGIAGVPAALDDDIAHDAAWRDPRLLLAQTCGYPYATGLRGLARLVATPIYDHPGCRGTINGSFVIVGSDDPSDCIAALRGRVAAINSWDSNSGMNLLRRMIAPHAQDGRFLEKVVVTGSHAASIAAVACGAADVAAIDCVTWGNLARFAPARLHSVRILAETAKTPGLPFVTRGTAGDAETTALRAALADVLADPAGARACATLGLRGWSSIADSAYDAVLALEHEAAALGYPRLA